MPADPGMHDKKAQVESVESAHSQIKIMRHEKFHAYTETDTMKKA